MKSRPLLGSCLVVFVAFLKNSLQGFLRIFVFMHRWAANYTANLIIIDLQQNYPHILSLLPEFKDGLYITAMD